MSSVEIINTKFLDYDIRSCYIDNTEMFLVSDLIRQYNLINKTNIKNECGNYTGIINALHWFGWGKNVKIVKLLKTDNKI